jgi:hypothetical protein
MKTIGSVWDDPGRQADLIGVHTYRLQGGP